MPTLADLFKTCYLTGGSGVEFSAIRLHYRGVDEICRAFGAAALTVGSDIFFRREAFAPHTPEGLRLLAHEVAHVVQQRRRPVTAGPAEESEADAAADALLCGRRFDFGAAGFPATARCWPAETERCTRPGRPRLRGGLSPSCWPTGRPVSAARRSSRAFRTTSNRRARSSPCASGMTAACATCVSASCSACGGPARREASRPPSAAGSACPHRTSRPCGTGNRAGSLSLMSTMDFTVRPATSAQWPALEDLFGRSGGSNGCWCMYWRIGPRYRDRPRADNKEDLRQLAASGRPPGLLAFDGDRAVGWCELAPRAELAWLARARYLGPVDDLPVWSVPCFYVRSSHRGRGVMDALIEAALPTAATAGAPALEAYPVDTTVPSHTGNLFPGIAAAFARHGFEEVARRKPDRPVMRKLLGDARDFST